MGVGDRHTDGGSRGQAQYQGMLEAQGGSWHIRSCLEESGERQGPLEEEQGFVRETRGRKTLWDVAELRS